LTTIATDGFKLAAMVAQLATTASRTGPHQGGPLRRPMIVFDTESDGFLDDATKLHVINLIDRRPARGSLPRPPGGLDDQPPGLPRGGRRRLRQVADAGGTSPATTSSGTTSR
jgi:hypothetical protein